MHAPAPASDSEETGASPATEGPTDVVYTAVFGGYESLVEEDVALDSETEFICFTDDPSLTSKTWRVELIEPRFPMDPIRSARWVKIFGEKTIWQRFNRSLWVDNRVSLKTDPKEILDSLLEGCKYDFALFEHSFRDRLIDEFDAVVEAGYDDPGRVYEQLIHYTETSPDVLDEGPLWTGLMARRHHEQMRAVMETWAAHVCRYSRRDQLSINVALRGADLNVRRMACDNGESEWHTWPLVSESLNRQGGTRSRAFEQAVRAPIARLRAIEREHFDLLEAHAISAAKRDKLIEAERTRAREFEALYTHQEGRTRELEALYADERHRRGEAEAALARSRQRVERLSERHERLRRRIVTLKKRVERLRRQVVILDKRAASQPATRSKPFRAQTSSIKKAGKRVAAKTRAQLRG